MLTALVVDHAPNCEYPVLLITHRIVDAPCCSMFLIIPHVVDRAAYCGYPRTTLWIPRAYPPPPMLLNAHHAVDTPCVFTIRTLCVRRADDDGRHHHHGEPVLYMPGCGYFCSMDCSKRFMLAMASSDNGKVESGKNTRRVALLAATRTADLSLVRA